MASKVFRKVLLNSRGFATAADSSHHGAGSMKVWKILTYTVALPGVGLCYLNAEMLEKEHKEHFHRPDFAPFEYLCIRTKPFPWGDGNHTLFHNVKVNFLPEGYEDE